MEENENFENEEIRESKDPNYVEELIELIRSDHTTQEISDSLDDYHGNDIASAFEELNAVERKKLIRILGAERASEVLSYVEDAARYIEELQPRQAAAIIENMDSDDAVDVLEDFDEKKQEELLGFMDEESKTDIQLIQSYEEDEIGSIMTTNFVSIGKNLSIRQAMKSLVAQAKDNDNISTLYVEDENGCFYGAIDLKDLIIARDYVELESLIFTSYPYVRDHDATSECLERIKDYAEDSIPVLDEEDHILGVITAQDIVEVVDDEMGDDYAKLAGLIAEEDLREPLKDSMRKRMPWLVILLFLGMVVSSVVGIFEGVISELAIIVSFQSLILDMAGNVGTQSLAVTIRVLMDENLKAKQKIGLVLKEMRVGACNGLILGAAAFLFIGLYIHFLKGNAWEYSFLISGCVGFAFLVAMIVSSFVGTAVPMFFHKIKVDPAVASGPLITTVNDLVAVVTYYGLAWVLLINALHITG